MIIEVITLFPELFNAPFSSSIMGRAREKGIFELKVHNLRDFTEDKHKIVDDYPFGGGPGMVLKIEPIWKAVEFIKNNSKTTDVKVISMSPSGRIFNHKIALELSGLEHIVLICGHYEGIDDRVRENIADEEISIGDYILTGGELPAIVIIDAVMRLVKGVLSEESVKNDSFYSSLLSFPQYTRPRTFKDYEVPEVLLSGNHKLINKWRRYKALERTLINRPDILKELELSREDKLILEELNRNLNKK